MATEKLLHSQTLFLSLWCPQVGLSLPEARSRLQRQRQEPERPHNNRRGQRQRRHRHPVSPVDRKEPLTSPRKPAPLLTDLLPFQAADRQDEQGDAGDGRSVWPIRSLRGAGIWGFVEREWRWAGPHQEEPPGYKEPYKWLGSGGAEWLAGLKGRRWGWNELQGKTTCFV